MMGNGKAVPESYHGRVLSTFGTRPQPPYSLALLMQVISLPNDLQSIMHALEGSVMRGKCVGYA